MSVRTDYLGSVFEPKRFQQTVATALVYAKKALVTTAYDTIVFTGNSGAALGYLLGAELKIPLLCVRKEGDNSHFSAYGERLEGWMAVRRYLFVDDFISSGDTFRRVINYMQGKVPEAKCVAALMYARSSGKTFDGVPLYGPPPSYDPIQYSFESWCERKGIEWQQ